MSSPMTSTAYLRNGRSFDTSGLGPSEELSPPTKFSFTDYNSTSYTHPSALSASGPTIYPPGGGRGNGNDEEHNSVRRKAPIHLAAENSFGYSRVDEMSHDGRSGYRARSGGGWEGQANGNALDSLGPTDVPWRYASDARNANVLSGGPAFPSSTSSYKDRQSPQGRALGYGSG